MNKLTVLLVLTCSMALAQTGWKPIMATSEVATLTWDRPELKVEEVCYTTIGTATVSFEDEFERIPVAIDGVVGTPTIERDNNIARVSLMISRSDEMETSPYGVAFRYQHDLSHLVGGEVILKTDWIDGGPFEWDDAFTAAYEFTLATDNNPRFTTIEVYFLDEDEMRSDEFDAVTFFLALPTETLN